MWLDENGVGHGCAARSNDYIDPYREPGLEEILALRDDGPVCELRVGTNVINHEMAVKQFSTEGMRSLSFLSDMRV